MVHIPKGTPRREIKTVIRNELYKRNFLREMMRIDAYFRAKERLQSQWDKQKIQFRTVLAQQAEKEYLEEKRGAEA